MLVALGLSALIVAAPTAFLALKLAGALYLAWLAVQAIRHGSALTLPDRPPARASLAATWASGLAINLLNPKIVIFFMTFLPQFVRPGDPHAAAAARDPRAPLHRHRELHHRPDDPRRRPGRRDAARAPAASPARSTGSSPASSPPSPPTSSSAAARAGLVLTLVDGAGQAADIARKAAGRGVRRGMHDVCTSYAQSMHQICAGVGGHRRDALGHDFGADGRNERDARRLAKSIRG